MGIQRRRCSGEAFAESKTGFDLLATNQIPLRQVSQRAILLL